MVEIDEIVDRDNSYQVSVVISSTDDGSPA
jgi:hypothetical protein